MKFPRLVLTTMHTSFLYHYSTIQYKTVDSIEFQGRTTAADQELKMKRIMHNSKLVTSNGERAKEIMEMRDQLKKLRMKTFPTFRST